MPEVHIPEVQQACERFEREAQATTAVTAPTIAAPTFPATVLQSVPMATVAAEVPFQPPVLPTQLIFSGGQVVGHRDVGSDPTPVTGAYADVSTVENHGV